MKKLILLAAFTITAPFFSLTASAADSFLLFIPPIIVQHCSKATKVPICDPCAATYNATTCETNTGEAPCDTCCTSCNYCQTDDTQSDYCHSADVSETCTHQCLETCSAATKDATCDPCDAAYNATTCEENTGKAPCDTCCTSCDPCETDEMKSNFCHSADIFETCTHQCAENCSAATTDAICDPCSTTYNATTCKENTGEAPCDTCCADACDPCQTVETESDFCPANTCRQCIGETRLNDTGITNGVATNDDADYGRDTIADTTPSDGHAGFSSTKLDSSGTPTAGTATCIQDNVTGLIWSPDQGDHVSWGVAQTKAEDANTESLCGKTDWRVPELRELLSIFSYDTSSYEAGSTVDTTYFSDTQVGLSADLPVWYWTATAIDASTQWGVTFQPIFNSTRKTASVSTLSTSDLDFHFARLVSGTAVTSNFTPIEAGGTIQDYNTGLIWQKCLEGQTFSSGSCTGTATAKTWAQALALDDGTWRIPNIKELQSIVGEETYFPAPAIDTYVWSSSPYAGDTSNSWGINFKTGILWNSLAQSTSGSVYVRLVSDIPAQ